MDRYQFVQSMNKNDISPETIVQFFDHTMALYDLVGKSENIEVSRNVEASLAISFSIRFQNSDQALMMQNTIRNKYSNTVAIYGRVFHVTDVLSDNMLNLRLI